MEPIVSVLSRICGQAGMMCPCVAAPVATLMSLIPIETGLLSALVA